jgi:acyl-CoA reductase-like NAD-dependent aldehyde dehydrogenase
MVFGSHQSQRRTSMSWRDSTLKYIKELMKPKPISEIIEKEMREAIIKKLEAESAVEYAASIVTYNVERIGRLQRRLKEHEGEE